MDFSPRKPHIICTAAYSYLDFLRRKPHIIYTSADSYLDFYPESSTVAVLLGLK
ncbi:MAG TPA: hypothetical protein VJ911_10620 [Cryomorphaceae bacterium]|nr:hypothetical protein [Cryomorphaceae bacterium]